MANKRRILYHAFMDEGRKRVIGVMAAPYSSGQRSSFAVIDEEGEDGFADGSDYL